ncbi:WD40-repeat-containing domain protein [Flagelloscypha sp. PMI_526]|nr:WD40-repeat-containing domain protein [Flagelloscypha sp. PMI_526]
MDLAKSCHAVSQTMESRFSHHPGFFLRLDVDGFDFLDLLQSGKAISHSRAYIARKETQELLAELVRSLITHSKRFDVLQISDPTPKSTEMSSAALDSVILTQDPPIREQLTISGDFLHGPTITKNSHQSTSSYFKTILPSHRLSPAELEERLEKILKKRGERSGINRVYKPIVDSALSMDDEGDTKQRWTILHVIISIAEPASVAFVAGLLGANPQLVAAVVQSLYPLLITANMDGPIYICHESFRGFVLSCTSGKFAYHPPSIHLLFAQACVKEMSMSLRFNICSLESSFTPDAEVQPSLEERIAVHVGALLSYASRNWWFHITRCDEVGKLAVLPTVEKLLQEKGIFWIEVMCLLGETKICKEILTELTSSSAIILMVPSIHLLASEASKLVSLFEEIPQKITSHIYLTCLALSEITPDLDCWRAQFSYLPNAITEQWSGEPNLDGHSNCVTSTAFSLNGEYIVSSSDDQTVCIWDVESGQKLRQLQGHTNPVSSAAFSPDSTRIVSGSRDNSVRIWDAESGEMLHQLDGHTGCVHSVAFSPNGVSVISGSEDQTVCIWDAESGMQLRRLNGHTDYVYSVAFSPDGMRIVSGSRDNSVRIWDVESGKELQRFSGHTDWVYSVAFSPDGGQIVSGSDDRTVRIWDTKSGMTRRCNGHTDCVHSVAFSPNGKCLVSGSRDKSIRIWDAASGGEVKRLDNPTGKVESVAFSPDGNYVVSGSDDRTIRLWEVDTSRGSRQFSDHMNEIRSVVFSPQVQRALPVGYHDTLETPMHETFTTQTAEVQRVATALTPESPCRVSAHVPLQSDFSQEPQPPIELPTSPHLPNAVVLAPTSLSLHRRDDGWLVTSKEDTGIEQKIIWIPPALRPFHPQAIPRERFHSIDLAGCTFGEGWTRCYTGRF